MLRNVLIFSINMIMLTLLFTESVRAQEEFDDQRLRTKKTATKLRPYKECDLGPPAILEVTQQYEDWIADWTFKEREERGWRVFKAIKWFDSHDLNGDGVIDVCEMAKYLRYLKIPRNQCFEEARAEIEYILDSSKIYDEPSYFNQDEFIAYSLLALKAVDA